MLALEAKGITAFDAYRDLVSSVLTHAGYASGDTQKGTCDWGQAAIFAGDAKPVVAIFDEMLDDAVTAMERMRTVRLAEHV